TSSPPPVVQAAASTVAEPVASAPASAATAASPAPPVEGPITFVEDDYAGALAQARARGVPLFIDTWAAWGHTCRDRRRAPRLAQAAAGRRCPGHAPCGHQAACRVRDHRGRRGAEDACG